MNEQECQAKGGRLVDGKCEMSNVIPSTSGFKSKKKSNNPFRMWGSWVGAIGLPIGNMLYQIIKAPVSCSLNNICSKPPFSHFISELFRTTTYSGESYVELFPPIYNTISFIVFGFLIGWILTLIWRKYKR